MRAFFWFVNLICILLPYASSLTVYSEMRQDTPVCLQATFKYSTCSWHLTFNVTSPPSAVGSVGFSPMFGGAPLHGPGPNGEGTLHLRLLVPNSQEDDKEISGNYGNFQGCYTGTTPSANFLTADDGTPFSGNALVVMAGGCPIIIKQQLAKYLNASIVMIAEAGYFYNNRDFADGPYIGRAGVLRLTDGGYLPTFGLSKDDGTTLISLIKSNNFSSPVNISIIGSGRIVPEDQAFMLNLSQTLHFPQVATPGITVVVLRDWREMADPTLDICYDGMVGVWCENGKVIHIYGNPAYQEFTGYISEGVLEQMTSVRAITLPKNTGTISPFPSNWCDIAEQMQLVLLRTQDSFSTFPDCWDRLPNLMVFTVQLGLQLQSLPMSIFSSETISFIYITGVTLNQTLPANLHSMRNLAHLALNFNSLRPNAFPNIDGLTTLKFLNMDLTDFSTGMVSSSFLNGFPTLRTVTLQNCKIKGPLPDFVGSQQYLTDISLNGNSFTGGIPDSWDTTSFVPNLITLQLHHNQLSQPPRQFLFGALQFATQLTKIDLSHNLLNYYDGEENMWSYNYFNFLTLLLPRSNTGLRSLDLSYNNFTGYLGNYAFQTGAVEEISLAHNNIKCLPAQFFIVNIPSWDFSYNDIEGSCTNKADSRVHTKVPGIPNDFVPPSFFKHLNLQGNPKLRSGAMSTNFGLPTYLKPQFDVMSERRGDTYLCGYAIGDPTTYLNMKILVDPEYNNHQLCSCQPGTYGAAPNCAFLPDFIDVNGSTKAIVASKNAQEYFSSASNLVSDGQYGNQRLITGMNSIFIFKSDNANVVVTNLLIYINLDTFIHDTDIISVYQGEQTDGILLFSIFGSLTRLQSNSTNNNNITNVRPYTNTGMFFVQVPRKEATIRYSSRQTTGSLFSVDYSFSEDCPSSTYYYSNSTGFCEPLLPCTNSDYEAVYGSCSISSTTMKITYKLKDDVVCLQTNTNVPPDQKISCESIPASASILAILIAFGSMVALLAFQPLFTQVYREYCAGKCCGSAAVAKKKTHAYGMEVFNGVWNIFLTASWMLQIITAAANFGEVETWKCNLRIYTIILGMFASQGSLFVSAKVISNYVSLQLINLKAFSIRSSAILFGGLFVITATLIVMTTTSGNMLSNVVTNLNSEQTNIQNVCTLGSALYFFAPLGSISIILTVINLFELIPPLLNLDRKLKIGASRLDTKITYLQHQHLWLELILLSLLTIFNFTSYLVVTATTYFGNYLQNNSMITKIQFAMYLTNVLVSILIRYIIPFLVQQCQRKNQAKKNTENKNLNSINLSDILVSQEDSPMIKVLDNPFYRWCLGKFLLKHEYDSETLNAFDKMDKLLRILSQVEYQSLNEILIISIHQADENKNNNNNDIALTSSSWFQQLSELFNPDNDLPFNSKLLTKFSENINSKISANGTISLKAFNASLYPIVKSLFLQLNPVWEAFSTSSEFVKPNAVSKWTNFFLNLDDDEKAHTVELLQSYLAQ